MSSLGCETAFDESIEIETETVIDRIAAWAARRPVSLALSGIALLCCLLGLAGSSFDYSLAAASIGMADGDADALVWSNILGDMAFASAASIGICALMLALSAWTAPQAMVEVVRPQPRRRDTFD